MWRKIPDHLINYGLKTQQPSNIRRHSQEEVLSAQFSSLALIG